MKFTLLSKIPMISSILCVRFNVCFAADKPFMSLLYPFSTLFISIQEIHLLCIHLEFYTIIIYKDYHLFILPKLPVVRIEKLNNFQVPHLIGIYLRTVYLLPNPHSAYVSHFQNKTAYISIYPSIHLSAPAPQHHTTRCMIR